MVEYGIFNDEACDHTENECLESGFFSLEKAQQAIADRYSDDDTCYAAEIEDEDDEDYEQDEEDEDEDEGEDEE